MEQSPSSEATRFSVGQDIPRILWNPKFHYHIYNSLRPFPILSQIYSVRAPTFHFLKIQLNIILPCTLGPSKWSLSLAFPHQNPVYISPLPHTCYMPRPYHSSRFDHSNYICDECRSLSASLRSFLHSPCYLVPVRSKYPPQHPILKHSQPTFLPQ